MFNFSKSAVGQSDRGNNKVGVQLSHYFKGYVYNEDGTIDLIPQTVAKSSKKSRKRSKFTTIQSSELDGMKEVHNWIEGTNTEQGETKTGEEIHHFINDEGDRQPLAQSCFYGATIDDKTLSATCELGIFRHYYAGFQKAVYTKRDKSGLGVNGELISLRGVSAIYAVKGDGTLVLEPVYMDDSINFTDHLIDGELIRDTKYSEMVEFYNKKNPYNLKFKEHENCFVDLQTLIDVCDEHEIDCSNLIETMDDEGFANKYDYEEFEAPEDNEEGDDSASQRTTLTIESLAAYTNKRTLKAYAKDELGLNIAFPTNMNLANMKTKVLETVNA